VRECLTDEFTGDGFELISRHLAGQTRADGFCAQTGENTLCDHDAGGVASVGIRRNAGVIGAENILEQRGMKTAASLGKESLSVIGSHVLSSFAGAEQSAFRL